MNFPGVGLPGLGSTPPGGGELSPEEAQAQKMVTGMQRVMESCYGKTVMSGVMGFGLGGVFGLFMASMSYDTPYHTATPQDLKGAGATALPATATAAKTSATTSSIASILKPTPLPASASSSILASTTATSLPTAASAITSKTTTSTPAPVLKPTQSLPLPTAQLISSLPLRQQLRLGLRDMGSRSWSSAKSFGTIGALYSGIECGIEGFRAKNDTANAVAAGCATGAILARSGGPSGAAIGCAGFAAFSVAIETYMRMPGRDDE